MRWVQISFEQTALIFSSARSEIFVDRPDPMENKPWERHILSDRKGRCRLYEALLFRGDRELQRGRAYGAAKN
jgi:hypothetical protein